MIELMENQKWWLRQLNKAPIALNTISRFVVSLLDSLCKLGLATYETESHIITITPDGRAYVVEK